jgi:choline dehydrogenase-like flavoprotein
VEAETFDYVIVGAGSAGCVLANRLTEDAGATVCLIEAGGRDRNPTIHIPLFGMVTLLHHKTLNWLYATEAQKNAAGRAIHIPRGKVLGGSSSINGMVYIRGHPGDYDEWAALGCSGWTYAECLPYFRRSENNEALGDSPYHGAGGPLNVTDPKRPNKLNEVFVEAAEQLQMRRRRDFNDGDQEGFGLNQLTQKNGRRNSTAVAYLDPARNRPNLKIVTDGLAARVLLDGKRATGIELVANGASHTIAARREVILAAGAIGSPAILMRSGIGAPSDLKPLGIEIAHPVPNMGRDLQDHMSGVVQVVTENTLGYGITLRAAPKIVMSGLEYIFFHRGMVASNVVEGNGYVRTLPGLDRPDIQFGFIPAHRGQGGRLVGYGHGYSISAILMRPKSRGTVALRSSDPRASPKIDLNAFAEPEDLDALLRGFKIARRLLEAPAFAPCRGRELKPGPDVQSDDALRDSLRETSGTIYHPVGTCRMGSDDGAVLDPELRLKGIAGLRVVDASIMPRVVGGNTNAPTIMIAEKASDMIRGRTPLPAANLP